MSEDKKTAEPCQPKHCGSDVTGNIQDLSIHSTLQRIKHKLLVMSGKGGVGKSTIASNLAVALSRRDLKVGLMDVDLHGPSIASMMGLSGLLDVVDGNFAQPKAFSKNLGVVSMASLLRDKDQAVIWRGPAKSGAIRKFISDIKWDDLDYLVVDSPPGTGDEPMTVADTVPDAQALIITTPQQIALGDVRKSINFCRHVGLSIMGIVENMGAFTCTECGEKITLFKEGGGRKTAEKESIPFLGTLPFYQPMVTACDEGSPVMGNNGKTEFHRSFEKIVDTIVNSQEAG